VFVERFQWSKYKHPDYVRDTYTPPRTMDQGAGLSQGVSLEMENQLPSAVAEIL
jgi:hypothetical protein